MRAPLTLLIALLTTALAWAAATATAATNTAGAARAADGRQDRYRSLLKERRALQRESAILEIEAKSATAKSPYVFLDLEAATLEFRVRGKVLKTYRISGLSSDRRGKYPVDAEAIWNRFKGPLAVEEVQGGQPELVPPDPEEGREHGLLFSDPNQLRDQTGAVEIDTDAGILGIEAPSEYWIRLKEPLILHVHGKEDETVARQALQRFKNVLSSIGSAVSSFWGGDDAATDAAVPIWITLEPEIAKQLHHSLLPGETIWLVPPASRTTTAADATAASR